MRGGCQTLEWTWAGLCQKVPEKTWGHCLNITPELLQIRSSSVPWQLTGPGTHGNVPYKAPDILALLAAGVPKILVRCVLMIILGHNGITDNVTLATVVELFAGCMQITMAFQRCAGPSA